ncbi:MAG: GspMb/PilO family protein [Planctomycetota bacterium]|nr:GspMb/PilO family protein [Planctomycetota bacterium]
MSLSKRETTIFAVAAVVVVAAMGNYLVVSPLLGAREDAQVRRRGLATKLRRAKATLEENRLLAPRWQEMTGAGIKNQDDEAVSQVLHAMRDWADGAGVSLSLLQRERQTEKTPLPTIAFQAAGTGTMESVSKLLWRMQNATIPVRVTELQVWARTEGTDDLSIQMRLSTVYLPGLAPTAPTAGTAGTASKGVER